MSAVSSLPHCTLAWPLTPNLRPATQKIFGCTMVTTAALLLAALPLAATAAGTLKVFVLAGQSNMEGHAEVATLDPATGKPKNGTLLYQTTDPRTAAEFAPLRQGGRWTVLDNVKVWFNEAVGGKQQGANGSLIPGVDGKDAHYGSLTTGYGCGDGNGGVQSNLIGPEYGFGFGLQDPASALKGDKVLIIKTAWGGKTIAVDFRPPSSSKGSMWSPPMLPNGGHYYNTMLQDVAKILAPGTIGKMYPDLAGMAPVISGFGWHQGWNDGCSLNQTAEYETNLVNLIKDLRKQWGSPNLPVSIAVSGFDGFDGEEVSRRPKGCWSSDATKTACNCKNDNGCRRLDVVLSQFGAGNATRHPELGGHISAMETRGFLRSAEFSPNPRQGYHWNHNAETYYLIGKAMASGMLVASGHAAIPGFTPGQTRPGSDRVAPGVQTEYYAAFQQNNAD